jgi:hypothetical protein
VKCDETRPHCRKCTETGRKCEGPNNLNLQFRFVESLPDSRSKRTFSEVSYLTSHSTGGGTFTHDRHYDPLACSVSKIKILSPPISVLQAQHSDIERRSFDFFIHRVAPCYAGAVEDDFWKSVVPCLALSDPIVWDIAVSSSYMFEHVPYDKLMPCFRPSSTPSATGVPHRQALKWYSRALSNLRQRLERSEMDSTYALLTCILCTCIEFQQKNVGNAMDLIQSGYKVLRQSFFTKNSATSAQTRALDEVVISFFSRHTLVVANFVIMPLSEWTDHSGGINAPRRSICPPSDHVRNTRSQLYHLMYQAYEVVRIAVLMWNDAEVIKRLLSVQRVTLDEMKRWRVLFTEHYPSPQDGMSDENTQWLTSHLLMCWDVCYIWLSTCTDASEMAYDKHMEHFAEIILHAERALTLGAQTMTDEQPPTKIGVGVVPPLYFTVMKCRDPVLRRKALHLLERAPPGGLWADVLTARVVQNAIALEEGQPYEHVDLANPESLTELRARPLPPEARRLQNIAFTGQEKSHAGYTISLQLGRIATDASGRKRTVHETIHVEDSTEAAAPQLLVYKSVHGRNI